MAIVTINLEVRIGRLKKYMLYPLILMSILSNYLQQRIINSCIKVVK